MGSDSNLFKWQQLIALKFRVASLRLKGEDRAWWYNSTSAVRGACFPPISVWTQPGWTARAPIYTNIVNFLLSSCLEDSKGPILSLRPVVERGQGSETWWPHWVRLWRSGKGRGLPVELECSDSKYEHYLFSVLSYASKYRWQVDHQTVLLMIILISRDILGVFGLAFEVMLLGFYYFLPFLVF